LCRLDCVVPVTQFVVFDHVQLLELLIFNHTFRTPMRAFVDIFFRQLIFSVY
jgi:hypothetical protein